ncbi:hypothetical protein B296_00057434 [Ensete ventricosum]|uniref:Uncharacterized protein n=1 Tax=Ensete ventricosum TaxID=4639 RepID=A0A426X0N5_ENSVE|nr:hypothetical protein B296_00057434 [Ensete ventricosum]
MGGATTLLPVVSKTFCSNSQTVLMIRKRPRNINGGGFVVMNTNQHIVFAVDGCGVLGVSGECMIRDGDGNSLLVIRRKGGVLQALSFNDQWRGYLMEYELPSKLVFSLHEQKSRIMMNSSTTRIYIEPKKNKSWDFEVRGSFLERACIIRDRRGNVVAEVRLWRETTVVILVKCIHTHAVVVDRSSLVMVTGGEEGHDGKQGVLRCGGATEL